jgi:Spy/CpxP family protein refolding chaperone
MSNKSVSFAIAVFLFSAAALVAQSSGAPSGNSPAMQSGHQEPCWKQAGITRSVMEQHQQIEHDAHSQVASVCEDSSLTPQQKQEKARQIRQQADEKINAIITPEQMSSLHACQQQRRGGNGGNMGHHGGNPCGNFGGQGRQGTENGNSGGTPQQPQN